MLQLTAGSDRPDCQRAACSQRKQDRNLAASDFNCRCPSASRLVRDGHQLFRIAIAVPATSEQIDERTQAFQKSSTALGFTARPLPGHYARHETTTMSNMPEADPETNRRSSEHTEAR